MRNRNPKEQERIKNTEKNESSPISDPTCENSDSPFEKNQHKGWYSRGYLPHRDEPGIFQAITYRLADSLPANILEQIEVELRHLPEEDIESNRRIRLEARLDAGYGSCILEHPKAASCVEKGWKHFDGKRYDLIAWVVMPNHVHVLVRLYEGVNLGKVIQSWKSYTARRIRRSLYDGIIDLDSKVSGARAKGKIDNFILNRLCRAGSRRSQGPDRALVDQTIPQGIWMREYWDRLIRDEQHFMTSVEYIHLNPVKAKLVKSPDKWPWSSASDNNKYRGINYFYDKS